MALQLDPRLPAVWRSPSSLQFGVDAPRVILNDLTNAQERMLAALAAGVSRSGLDMIARAAGADANESALLLEAVRPALLGARPPSPGTATVFGSGEAVERIALLLGDGGVRLVARDGGGGGGGVGLAIIVADYVIPPELHGRLLRRDIPHLPVVFGDGVVRIGPLIEPGSGPCLYCLERRRTDADPAWPAIASQLWGRRSPLHDRPHGALVAGEVAGRVARLALGRLRDGPSAAAESVDLDAATGTVTVRQWEPHPECACTAFAEV